MYAWGSVGKIEFERQPGNRVMEYVEEMETEGDKGGDVMVEEVFSLQQLFCSRCGFALWSCQRELRMRNLLLLRA